MGKSPTVTTFHISLPIFSGIWRKLTVEEIKRCFDLPIGFHVPNNKTSYKLLGNSLVPTVVKPIMENLARI